MKALKLLKSNKTVAERADTFVVSIKRDIQREVIDKLTADKEKLDDEIFELGNFTLDTDHNKGLKTMSKDDCKTRFMRLIQAKYELKLVTLELKEKQAIFDEYFSDETTSNEQTATSQN